jgi:hypothetical protein
MFWIRGEDVAENDAMPALRAAAAGQEPVCPAENEGMPQAGAGFPDGGLEPEPFFPFGSSGKSANRPCAFKKFLLAEKYQFSI